MYVVCKGVKSSLYTVEVYSCETDQWRVKKWKNSKWFNRNGFFAAFIYDKPDVCFKKVIFNILVGEKWRLKF